MALRIHEALKKFGKPVRVEIGRPIPWQQLSEQGSRTALTQFLYGKVQALSESRIAQLNR